MQKGKWFCVATVALAFVYPTHCCFSWWKKQTCSSSQSDQQGEPEKSIYAFVVTDHCLTSTRLGHSRGPSADMHIISYPSDCLMAGVEYGSPQLVKRLLANGADANVREHGCTPLCIACWCKDYEMARCLLAAGAWPNQQGSYSWTPMMIAAHIGATAIAHLLWCHGAYVNQISVTDGISALYLACQGGYADCVQFLLYAGASVNYAGFKHATPLHIALSSGHSSVVPLLLKAGADIMLRNQKGESPLWLAAKYGLEEVVQQLLEAGADPEQTGPGMLSPLNVASQRGHHAVVAMLLHAGADLEHRGCDGATALYCALKGGNAMLAQRLVEWGADTNVLFEHKGVLDLLSEVDFIQHKNFINEALRRGFSRHTLEQLSAFAIEAEHVNRAKNDLHQALSGACFQWNNQCHFPRDLHMLIGSFVGGALAQRHACFQAAY